MYVAKTGFLIACAHTHRHAQYGTGEIAPALDHHHWEIHGKPLRTGLSESVGNLLWTFVLVVPK
jgi:hypothetical protein